MARAVAKKSNAQLAEVHDLFLADAGSGVDDLGSEDLAIPFVKILQRCPTNLTTSTTPRPGTSSTV